jgi:choline-glycine betaine transporter
MAQTKRKTKHRGNAAGMVESRGRTGRPPTAAERKGTATGKSKAREQQLNRLDRPPTWRGAIVRAMLAAILMLLIGIVVLKNSSEAIALFPIVLLLYIPISYYTDAWMYKRRQRQKANAKAKAKAEAKAQ